MPHKTESTSSPLLRLAIVVAALLSTFVVGVCLSLLLAGCGAASKPILRQVDEHVQLACEGLAQALAERSGADASRIIATTCAVEGITRTMRELLFSQQLEAAKRAGVSVPEINSAALEPDPYQSQDAE